MYGLGFRVGGLGVRVAKCGFGVGLRLSGLGV